MGSGWDPLCCFWVHAMVGPKWDPLGLTDLIPKTMVPAETSAVGPQVSKTSTFPRVRFVDLP